MLNGFWAAFLGIGLVLAATAAQAQDPEALARVRDLNKKAVDAYENLELEEARKSLMTALEICATEGLNRHTLKAQTHLNLGVVLVGGAKQRDAGTKQFRRALEIDPNIRVPKRLANPEITGAFNDAIREQTTGAPAPPEPGPTPPAGATPPPPTEPTAAPKPPAAGGAAIGHAPVTDARPNEELPIKATIDESLRFDRVVLAYRPEGASDFLARDMEPETGTEYVARIPEPATRGNTVAYYIEARGRGGQALARNGSPDEPHVITLAGGAGGPSVTQVDSGERPDEGPGGAGAGRFWLSMGVGAGGGYVSGVPEVNPNYLEGTEARTLEVSSVAGAKLMHFVPEIGYFVSPKLLLSLQGRLQYTTGATEVHHMSCGDSMVCKPATGAVALLGRATWFLGQNEKLQPYFSLVGGGGYVRYLVDLSKETRIEQTCGPNANGGCIDTVAGGGLLIGPAAGIVYALTPGVFFNGGVTALLGIPKTAFNFDLNVGLGFKL